MSETHHISVCICTYKRPKLLEKLLLSAEKQDTEGRFYYSIVVIDNDRFESAREIVESYKLRSKLQVSYAVEPEQNIALARNKAVENSNGDFIAFIDDDEFPEHEWLLNLYIAMRTFGAHGILGQVKTYFETERKQRDAVSLLTF